MINHMYKLGWACAWMHLRRTNFCENMVFKTNIKLVILTLNFVCLLLAKGPVHANKNVLFNIS